MQPRVLITGATAGIGRATALHLARQGCPVIATGRSQDALDRLADDANELDVGSQFSVEHLDVTDAASIARCRQAVEAAYGDVPDALVNNAGFSSPGPLELVADAELHAQFDTNVFGLLAVIREFVPAMRARGSGRIVNVSSVMGRMALPLHGPYNASKYAVEGLTDALRMELAPFGITVVAVEPGTTNTAGHRIRALTHLRRYGEDGSPYADDVRGIETAYEKAFSRAPQPERVARLIERAISARRPAARYIRLEDRLTIGFSNGAPTALVDRVKRRTLGYGSRSVGSTTPAA
jgi:NAD(P)-dependent dehydrogenase (short-subunit alcohol dehydrogenase family)